MKKFLIFLITLIFLIGGLIGGYFIGQNAETIKSRKYNSRNTYLIFS